MESIESNKNEVKYKARLTPLTIVLVLFLVIYIISVLVSFKIISSQKTKTEVFAKDLIKKDLIKKESKNKVAVIPIYGAIYKRDWSISERGSDLIVSMIKKYGEDKNIKAIVLDINSPGGSIGAVQEIYSIIKKIKEKTKKPFVAHFGDVAASGAYYIAMACDRIVSNSGTITGSIGVIFSAIQGEELFKKVGVRTSTIKSGRFKDIGSFSREMTKEEKALLQAMIDDTYNIFLDVVSKSRNIDKEKLKDIADGRIFTGNQALSLGLVDKIGDLYDAIDEAGSLSGIGKNPSVIRARQSIFSDIFDTIDSKISIFSVLDKNRSPLLEYRMAF